MAGRRHGDPRQQGSSEGPEGQGLQEAWQHRDAHRIASKDRARTGEWVCGICRARWLFAITCIGKDGLRVLIGPAQGRFMKSTRAEAEEGLRQLLANNAESRLAEVYGKQAMGTFRVDEFECWHHGDPKGIYVDDEAEVPGKSS